MLLLNLPIEQVQLFMFVLVRVGAILFSIPFLEARNVPRMVKASLAMAVSVMLMPQLDLQGISVIGNPVQLALGIAGEAAVGLIIGSRYSSFLPAFSWQDNWPGFRWVLPLPMWSIPHPVSRSLFCRNF